MSTTRSGFATRILVITISAFILLFTLVGCASDTITQGGDPTPTPEATNTPAPADPLVFDSALKIDPTTFQSINENVPVLSMGDKIVSQGAGLGCIDAKYLSMPPYLPQRINMANYGLPADTSNLFYAIDVIDGNEYWGAYSLTEDGYQLSPPKVYQGEVTINGQTLNYWDAYYVFDNATYNATRFDHNPYEQDGRIVEWLTFDEDGPVSAIFMANLVNAYDREISYPYILYPETGEVKDFVREISSVMANELAGMGCGGLFVSGSNMVFYTDLEGESRKYYHLNIEDRTWAELDISGDILSGNPMQLYTVENNIFLVNNKDKTNESYYCLNIENGRFVEMDVPQDAKGTFKSRKCLVIDSNNEMVLWVRELVRAEAKSRQYILYDVKQAKMILLKDLIGENLYGCSVVGEKLFVAGEDYYWSVDTATYAIEKVLENRDVVLGFDNPHANNTSFVVVKKKGEYLICDFVNKTISSLGQLGRWAEMETVSQMASPDGRKLAIFSTNQEEYIQFAILNCDTNELVDVVRKGDGGAADETKLWWYSDDTVAISQSDYQKVSMYSIK